MFRVITLNSKRAKTHIAKGRKVKFFSICGMKFKRTWVKSVEPAHIEHVTCKECMKVINANPDLFLE